MRKLFFYAFLTVAVIWTGGYAAYTALIHGDGPNQLVVESGGKIDVKSGGELELSSGCTFDLGGTAVTSNATELNELDGWIMGFLDCDTDPDTVLDSRVGAGSAFHVLVCDSVAGTATATCVAGSLFIDTEGLSTKDVVYFGK